VVLGTTDFTNTNLFTATGLGSESLAGVTWSNTVCPDGTNSDGNAGTCASNVTPPSAPVVTVDMGVADGSNGWFKTLPVQGTVTAVGSPLAPIVGAPVCEADSAPLMVSGSGPWTVELVADGVYDIECSATDLANNTGMGTAFAQVDSAFPTGSTSQLPVPNVNGWNSGPVTLSATMGTTTVSGLDPALSFCTVNTVQVPWSEYTVTEPDMISFTLSDDGEYDVVCTVTTMAGLSQTHSTTVKIDSQVPSGPTSVLPAANASGWHSVEPTLRAVMTADNVSGIDGDNSGCTRNGVPVPLTEYDFTPPNILDIVVHDDGVFEYVCTVTNLAGVSDSSSQTVKVDKAAVGLALSAPAGEWHPAAVDVDLEITGTNVSGIDAAGSFCTVDGDPLAAVFPASGPATVDLTVAGDGIHDVVCQVTTVAGKVTSTSTTVKIDSQVPSGPTSVLPAANANGWNTGPVTLSATMDTSTPSGLDPALSFCTVDSVQVPWSEYTVTGPDTISFTLSDDGEYDVVCTVTTNAGLSQTESATVRIDSSPPPVYAESNAGPEFAVFDFFVGNESPSLSGIDLALTSCTRDGNPVAPTTTTTIDVGSRYRLRYLLEGLGTSTMSCTATTYAGLTDTVSVDVTIS
jgi:plastocyanin